MRQLNHLLDGYRVREGQYASPDGVMWGAFRVPCSGLMLLVISSGPGDNPFGQGWEHVSVSLPERCPTWEEMCYVKELFWRSDEWVMQLHPAKVMNINHHPHCLHLWRPADGKIPLPPPELVGPKKAGLE